jgi:hypothetical protein
LLRQFDAMFMSNAAFPIGAIANQSRQDRHSGRAEDIHIKLKSGAMAAEAGTTTMPDSSINPAANTSASV